MSNLPKRRKLAGEVKCTAKDRGGLDSVFRDVVGESGSIHHLVPRVEVEIMDIDSITEVVEVEGEVRSCLREEPTSELEVTMRRRPIRGTRKVFIKLEEARALKLLKTTHIKIGWICCRVRRKTVASRC